MGATSPDFAGGANGAFAGGGGHDERRGFLWHGRGAGVGGVAQSVSRAAGDVVVEMVGNDFFLLGGHPRRHFHALPNHWRDDWARFGAVGRFGVGRQCAGVAGDGGVFIGRNAIAADGERGGDGDDGQPAAAGVDADGRIGGDGGVAAVFAQAVLSRGGGAVSPKDCRRMQGGEIK